MITYAIGIDVCDRRKRYQLNEKAYFECLKLLRTFPDIKIFHESCNLAIRYRHTNNELFYIPIKILNPETAFNIDSYNVFINDISNIKIFKAKEENILVDSIALSTKAMESIIKIIKEIK